MNMSKIHIKSKLFFTFVILSLLVGIILYCFCVSATKSLFMYIFSLIIFIPTLYIFKDYLKFDNSSDSIQTKIRVIIKNSLIISFQIIVMGLFMLMLSSLLIGDEPKTDTAYYKNFESHVMEKDKVAHFPRKIPKAADNFIYYRESGRSEGIYIAFDIDKKYIEDEIKKHEFTKIEGPYKNYGDYNIYFPYIMSRLNEKAAGYKVYYLTIRSRGDDETHHLPAINGIAIKGNRIVYFYGSLD